MSTWIESPNVQQDTAGWFYKITKSYGVLSEEQKQQNAYQVYLEFHATMSLAAIAGILGNMERESGLNPGQIEGDSIYNVGWTDIQRGHGLIQWTNSDITKPFANPLIDKQSTDEANNNTWASGKFQCQVILKEGAGEYGSCFYANPEFNYNYTWDEFCKLTDYKKATSAYLYQRERAGVVAEQERFDFAEKWYKFLLSKTAVEVIHPKGATSERGIYSGTATDEEKETHYLIQIRDDPNDPEKVTTKRFLLKNFCNGNQYKYSKKTIELLEILIRTYPYRIRDVLITSTWRPYDTGIHNIGAAVDLYFYSAQDNEEFVDCRYIAIAAAELGFTGIGPMHNTGNLTDKAELIHLDTRADYVAAGGSYNSLWYGWEKDPGNDDYYEETGNISSNYYDFYDISNVDFLSYMGQPFTIEPTILPPRVSDLQLIERSTESAKFSVEISGNSIDTISYNINGKEEINLDKIDVGTVYFTVDNLIPNTKYSITVTARNSVGMDESAAVDFTTLQDYPDPVQKVTLTYIGEKPLSESQKFSASIEQPVRWGYWKDKANNSYGYLVYLVKNGYFLFEDDYYDYTTNIFRSQTLDSIPENAGFNHEDIFQVGVSSWVKDNDGNYIYALEGHKEFPVCSNSIKLMDISEMSDYLYTVIGDEINRVQAYIQSDGSKMIPLKVFKT